MAFGECWKVVFVRLMWCKFGNGNKFAILMFCMKNTENICKMDVGMFGFLLG
jgi:hypothetical protein